jgi:hypothetical protein
MDDAERKARRLVLLGVLCIVMAFGYSAARGRHLTLTDLLVLIGSGVAAGGAFVSARHALRTRPPGGRPLSYPDRRQVPGRKR